RRVERDAGAGGQVLEQVGRVGQRVEAALALLGRPFHFRLVHAELFHLPRRRQHLALRARLGTRDRRRAQPEAVIAVGRPRLERFERRPAAFHLGQLQRLDLGLGVAAPQRPARAALRRRPPPPVPAGGPRRRGGGAPSPGLRRPAGTLSNG